MKTAQMDSVWLVNAEELTAIECTTLMGGGFWCDVGDWLSQAWEWAGRFVESLDHQLAETNYYHDVLMPDQVTVAAGIIDMAQNEHQWTSLQDAIDSALDAWVVSSGFNTLEFWGEAVGAAAAEATYGD